MRSLLLDLFVWVGGASRDQTAILRFWVLWFRSSLKMDSQRRLAVWYFWVIRTDSNGSPLGERGNALSASPAAIKRDSISSRMGSGLLIDS